MKEKEMKDMKDWEQIAINTYKLPIEGGASLRTSI